MALRYAPLKRTGRLYCRNEKKVASPPLSMFKVFTFSPSVTEFDIRNPGPEYPKGGFGSTTRKDDVGLRWRPLI
jgi:hypothetical protein